MSVFSITGWTAQQWTAFTGLVVAGLAALGLLALLLQHLRHRRAERAEIAQLIDRWRATSSDRHAVAILAGPAPLPLPAHVVVDPTGEILEHIAPGTGSVTSIREAGEGSLTRVEPADLIDPEVSAWFAAAFDRPARAHATPGDDAAPDEGGVLTRWRTAIEPAMRTARLWEIQGRGNAGVQSARQALDRWRIECPTGEWPLVPAR